MDHVMPLIRCAVFTALASAGAAAADSLTPLLDGSNRAVFAQAPSRDALFGDDLPKTPRSSSGSKSELFGGDAPSSTTKPPARGDLFGDDAPRAAKAVPDKADGANAWRGYLQTELAYGYDDPEHWSKARLRLELGRQGRLSGSVKYKVTGRFDYDAVFDIEPSFYPRDVEREQRRSFQFRETYLDVSAGNWELRLGRQHVVWGEVPGLFFADVVSAKDLREFVLPEFDSLRIPQWAARAEYFSGGAHLEFLWIPWVTVDRIGKPGTEFFPFPPPPPAGFGAVFQGEQQPTRTLRNSNYGVRVSTLASGWDLSGFLYRAIDTEANFYRQVVAAPTPAFVFSPRHDRITQIGGTLSKDLGAAVLKAEAIYTKDKGFSVRRLTDPTGVAKLDILDYLIGADFTLGADTRLYTYGFQRRFLDHDADIVPDRVESGATVQLTHKVSGTLELQALLVSSLNRSDWAFRPRVAWNVARNWRLNAGVDILHGPTLGFFGRFADKDRVYADLRYSF